MSEIEYEWNQEKTKRQGRKAGQTLEILVENDNLSKDELTKILGLPKLEKLEIINCNLKVIPNAINRLKNSLRVLNLEGNNILSVPDNLVFLIT
ncbi:MAG: Unknown protein [uncultured Sulfurovum sp.]|uniref:Uncharacterized protein n=1 Tax=uncultured Sulfurovum sp. TaxID=269237 RepID=A0A6S6TJZ1_9BACT|nr:MAG: Unknown protein [uncultured Sulfurovum sp.]